MQSMTQHVWSITIRQRTLATCEAFKVTPDGYLLVEDAREDWDNQSWTAAVIDQLLTRSRTSTKDDYRTEDFSDEVHLFHKDRMILGFQYEGDTSSPVYSYLKGDK
jgi:hypothetical protein